MDPQDDQTAPQQYNAHMRSLEADFDSERNQLVAENVHLKQQASKAADEAARVAELQVPEVLGVKSAWPCDVSVL